MPRVPEEGKLRANHRDPGSPIGVRDLLTPVRTSHERRANIPPGGGGSGATTCSAGAGASLPLEDSPTHRFQCGWLRRALPPRHAGQPLSGLTVDRILPRYTVQPPAQHPHRAVCRINWIRRHGTFPSCRLCRKLHGPFSYAAGDAAGYAWRRFDKTAPRHAERGIQGAAKEIQERDLLRLRRRNI